MRTKLLALLVPAAVLLSACGVSAGTVVSKEVVPPHWEVDCMHIGNNPCVPYNNYIPACYWMALDSGDQGCVSPEEYDSHDIGSFYTDEETDNG